MSEKMKNLEETEMKKEGTMPKLKSMSPPDNSDDGGQKSDDKNPMTDVQTKKTSDEKREELDKSDPVEKSEDEKREEMKKLKEEEEMKKKGTMLKLKSMSPPDNSDDRGQKSDEVEKREEMKKLKEEEEMKKKGTMLKLKSMSPPDNSDDRGQKSDEVEKPEHPGPEITAKPTESQRAGPSHVDFKEESSNHTEEETQNPNPTNNNEETGEPIHTDSPEVETQNNEETGDDIHNEEPPNHQDPESTLPVMPPPPGRNERKMEQWKRLVKRLHQVVALLIGLSMWFAPIKFVTKTVKSFSCLNCSVPATVVRVFKAGFLLLDAINVNLVIPFLACGCAYGVFYFMSAASAIPTTIRLCFDMVAVCAGVATFSYLFYWVHLYLCIAAVICYGVPAVILFAIQYPRIEVVAVPAPAPV